MKVNERKLMALLYAASFLLLWKIYWALIGLACSGQAIAWENVLFLFALLGVPLLLVPGSWLAGKGLKNFCSNSLHTVQRKREPGNIFSAPFSYLRVMQT